MKTVAEAKPAVKLMAIEIGFSAIAAVETEIPRKGTRHGSQRKVRRKP